MDAARIMESLSMAERKIFPLLSRYSTIPQLSKESGLSEIEVMRQLQWMYNKKLLEIDTSEEELVNLERNGVDYRMRGLPEKRLLLSLDKEMTVEDAAEKAGIAKEELNISIGALRKKNAIELKKDKSLTISLTEQGRLLKKKEFPEDAFLKKNFPLRLADLGMDDKQLVSELEKRKDIVKVEKIKTRSVRLLSLGIELLKVWRDDFVLVEKLTPGMIKSGEWKDKKFRRYDVTINVPKISGGKRHYVNQAISYAKRIWIEMGFGEMTGDLVDTSFWVFDSLFTPQDHPVREMQDTFFIEDPEHGKLPDKRLVEAVKRSHEGGVAGSLGWQYRWKEDEARRNVLRTHTTVLSARTLSSIAGLKGKKKGKYFALGRNFRNETIDWSHLFEFNQTEGIVVDPDANFRHLLGYLREFFRKMGYPEARFRPGFFSYTEPSVEVDVFHPVHKKWVEFGGAGIFRPEVVIPLLGEDIPVLAWGPGFDRIYLEYYDIKDIRDLYKNDLKMLRESKAWMR